MGSFCSLILLIIVLAYTYIKTDTWIYKEDVDIMSSTQPEYFSDSYIFDYSQGLNFAIAFTAYDNERDDILDPSYGRLSFERY